MFSLGIQQRSIHAQEAGNWPVERERESRRGWEGERPGNDRSGCGMHMRMWRVRDGVETESAEGVRQPKSMGKRHS